MARTKNDKAANKRPAGGDEHGHKDVRAQLAQIGGEAGWQDVEERSFGDVPDGPYQVRILSATINNAKSESHRLQVSWDLLILNTKERGRHLFKHDGIDDADGLAWLRGGLSRLGVDWPAKPDELPDTLDSLVGSYAEVKAKTKEGNDIQNVHFNKALDSEDLEDGDIDEEGATAPKGGAPATPAATAAVATPSRRTAAATPAAAPVAAAPAKGGRRKAPEPAAPPEEPEGVSTTFTDDDLTGKGQKEILEIGKALDFKPEEYETKTDMLADMAEFQGLAGEYDDATQLIQDVKKSMEK